jgi:hypothetical protein
MSILFCFEFLMIESFQINVNFEGKSAEQIFAAKFGESFTSRDSMIKMKINI